MQPPHRPLAAAKPTSNQAGQLHVQAEYYNRVLESVEQATHTITAQPLTTIAELKKVYDLYEHAKSVCTMLPHSSGRALAQEHLLFLYKYIVDSRQMIISEDFNTKTSLLVNLIDKATRRMEENKSTDTARLYGKAQELFAALPEEPLLAHKKENMRRHLDELHQRMVHAAEIEQEQRAYRQFHAIETLLQRAAQQCSSNPAGARKIYDDIVAAYRGLQVPPHLLSQKAALRKHIHTLEGNLKPEKKEYYVPPEQIFSPELVGLIAGTHSLKTQPGFLALIKLLTSIESCRVEQVDETRESFFTAKKIAVALHGDKRVLNPCFAKIRSRLELLAALEKIRHARSTGEIHAVLAQVQRRTLDYNARYPHDHAFTDRVYGETVLLQAVLDEGVTAG